MWLQLEDGRLLNADMLTHIEVNDKDGTAIGWGYGVGMTSPSKALFEFAAKLSNVGQEKNG